MHQSFTAAALIAVLMLAGCGQSNNPPPAATPAAPASTEAAPPATDATPTATVPESADALVGDAPLATVPSATVTKEEMPDEPGVPNAVATAPAESAPQVAADEPAEADAAPARPRANRPARKLLRGLASSLTRAVAKAVNDQSTASGDKPAAPAGEANGNEPAKAERPAVPPKSGDPFPQGEPDDAKPNE